ncbi:hypothetical protein DMP08_05250 [Paraeggerthella hongkongensis]|uniref:Uncharacterized protein n=1 Tax=Paraeggerthella hongkongensis TaxID=230658 RepID=A0A3N0BEW6_9ACTN|nr:hypothetical protein DMP08_05250 [Paraeggerthella hongkongensis]
MLFQKLEPDRRVPAFLQEGVVHGDPPLRLRAGFPKRETVVALRLPIRDVRLLGLSAVPDGRGG